MSKIVQHKMTKISYVRLLTICTFLLSLTQTSCGEHICLPTIISAFAFLFIETSFELWGLAYILGTFGQIYVIVNPNKKVTKYIYGICFILLLFPMISYYLYWQHNGRWINNNIFWRFNIPYLILSLINLYLLFKKTNSSNQTSN